MTSLRISLAVLFLTMSDVPSSRYTDDTHIACDRHPEGGASLDGSPLKRAMRTVTLGKSFSSATAIRYELLRRHPEADVHHRLSSIEYTSIDQFQQRAELYRGRYNIQDI